MPVNSPHGQGWSADSTTGDQIPQSIGQIQKILLNMDTDLSQSQVSVLLHYFQDSIHSKHLQQIFPLKLYDEANVVMARSSASQTIKYTQMCIQ